MSRPRDDDHAKWYEELAGSDSRSLVAANVA
jgi:hypothetical protein